MSTKDLFNKSNKVLTKSQADKIKTDLESPELSRDVVRANNKFHSHVDYSKPENFSFYGSAQKYYEDSFNRIYQTYPYDGSQSEKEKWFYDSSELDLWIMDNAYPKSVGHIRLGSSQSVFVKGGPNNQPGVIEGEKEELSKQFPVKQGNSNIWDTSIYRNSNLYVDGSLGNTVEFWAKLENTFSGRVVLYNIANEAQSTILSATYFSTGLLVLSAKDDAGNTTTESTTITDLITDSWNHVSFCTVNEGSQIKFEVYKNGTLVYTNTTGTALTSVSQAELSLNINGVSNGVLSTDGLYVDEFRFWKRRRTEEEIGRYWHTHIHGGTNTDDNKYNTENRKVDIGIYYKFNEGITGNTNIDSTVLDYSGRISNGEILNYDSSVRSTVSAFDASGFFEVSEDKEPIIYSSHPDFVSARETYMQEGLTYDYTNNSSIYHTMPAWIIEEDEEKGENVKELSQVISSYFDSAQIKIKELVNLKEVEYHTLEERTSKPYSLIRRTLESAGMVVPDLFTEASAFEEILSRGEQEKFEEKLQDVKNTIYQNIYNNLSYIYKSKGTEKAFRNLIRCFGVDDELVKINLYSDGADYTLEDTRRTTAIKKKFVDFNNADRDQGLIYTKADPGNADSTSYIRGISNGATPNLSFTFETQVIFPKRLSTEHPAYDPPTNDEEHIAFLGEYSSGYSASELFDLKAEKENSDPLSENVRFVLTFDGQTLQTEYFKSVYENSKWNLAVRLVPKKNLSGVVSGGSTTDYRAELYCVRMLADVVEDEELVTADIAEANARALLSKDKYVSIGALHSSGDPETESLDNDTRLKISSTLFWYDNITDEEVRAHASDASNFGRLHPSEEAYMFDDEFNTDTSSAIQVPRRDTLAMHWDFSEVTTTDGSGEFIVDDLSEDFDKSTIPINAKAIQFDGDITAGQTDHVKVLDSDDFSFTDGASNDEPFSISAWVYVENASGGDNGPFVSKATVGGATPTEYIFKHESGRLRAFLYSGSGFGNSVNIFANSAGITNSTWHNVVMTYDGSNTGAGVTFYVDASPQAATVSTSGTYSGMTNTSEPLIIGRTNNDPPSAGQAFEDKIADVCIFNKELSQAEVTEIYNSNAVKNMYRFSDKDSIISWWKMGDDLDTTGANGIKDYIGSNHGTLTNGASIVDEVTLSTDNIITGRYGWFTDLVGHQVTGKGVYFTEDDKQIVNREFIHSAKHRTPEVINSEDLVEIRSQDDLTFTKDAQVVTHFFAAEKSMYQTISDDMINLFATIVEFNDLIGQPVNRYRLQYKALEKFRARYFEKVNNVPSLEKYIELYKWIDSSIGLMLQELIPVSSNFSADLRNMVESHVLERNKYWTKFPTLEMAGEPPLGIVKGINELTYNWKDGHTPVGSETIEDDKFLYGDQRVQGTDPLITTGDSDVDDNREVLRRVSTRTTAGRTQIISGVEQDMPILRESPLVPASPGVPAVPGPTYSGQAYVTRALAKPYRLNLDIAPTIHGGSNFSPTTKDPNAFIRAATRIIPGVATVGIDIDNGDNPTTYEEWKKLYKVKRTTTITISDTETSLTEYLNGDFAYPYYGADFRDASPYITGQHSDSYGDDAEIPMQGPFTETWVGGNQHRHIFYKTQTDRPELYIDDAGVLKHPHEVDPNLPAARFTRDELAKRPVNIENIKTEGDQPFGNYQRDYEIVQTSGRTKNNSWFVSNEGVSLTETTSPFISGTVEFSLPDRGRTEHVFVERFSAPGDPLTLSRGYLDTLAEEFSVYNSVNFRNLEERLDYQRRLYTHSGVYQGSQGYEDTTTGIPSVHKVNRNPALRPLETGCKTLYDNAYVSHQIPRSDLQYAFITASIDYDKYRPGEAPYPHPHTHCAADTIPVRFSGYYDDIHIVKGDEGYEASYADYQGAGYRFIRNVENSQVISQRKTNTYSQLNRTPRNGALDRSVSTFVEPAVVWNKPNTHYVLNEEYSNLAAQGETLGDLRKNVSPLTYSYSNNLEVFSNEELTRAVDIDKTSKSGFSETLMEVFKKAELLFSRSVARELIFPKHKNVGLKKTRFRSEFDTYKFFWKDKMFDRVKCSNTTKLGYEMTPEFQRLFKQKFSVDVMDGYHFSQSSSTEQEHYKVIGDLTYMGEDRTRHMITRKDLDITDTEHPLYDPSTPVGFLGLEEICEAESTSSDIVPVYSSVEIERNKTAPIPSPQLYHNPYNESYKESEGWINRKPITSDNKPAYNDYDSFSEEVKLAAQNYGLVSEFRISEHMDKYILENGGNFRAKNYDFLTLDGASHDGEFHTLSSGTSIKETSSFYSIKKEDNSLTLTAYPTSSSDDTLVKNNAEGFFGYNPIYAPSNSTFSISNSVNSNVEINASSIENYTSIEPYQNGTSAAGKFDLDTTNDYLVVNINSIKKDNLPPLSNGFRVDPNATFDDMPIAVSIWAQPETIAPNTSYGMWSAGSGSGERSINLFSHYYYMNGHTSYQNLGLTFVVSDGTATPDEGMPGTTLGATSSVYTFFNSDGSIALLSESKMNNIVVQLVPPSYTATSGGEDLNYLIKVWLNGDELYGVNVAELTSSNYLSRNSGGQSISAYSPCPMGDWKHIDTSPWFADYDTSFSDANLKGITTISNFVVGNCNYHQSRDNSASTGNRFKGILDEFTIFRGILPSDSISAIFNNGIPNNVNELLANNQIVGNCVYDTTVNQSIFSGGQVYSFPVPATVDNGEFDLGGKYYSNFESASGSNIVPLGWTTNESDETPANGPTIQASTLGAGNSVFGLRGHSDLHSDVDDPPGPTGASNDHYRWIQHPQVFATGIEVSFKVYEGRSSGDYDLTEAPDKSAGEDLWLQYKVGTAGTWTTSGSPIQAGDRGGSTGAGQWNLINTVTRTINGVGESQANPIYLRWISYAEVGSSTSNADTWGVDDIEISEVGITAEQYIAAEAQRIQILAGSTAFVQYSDFDEENYSKEEQQLIEASLPVWHRIGVPSYDKVVNQGQWDSDFFNSYVHTDNINFIEKADKKHDELAVDTTETVKLKVNAIKKLLPYEGFYPQDRVVQIANLFVEKISPDIIHDEKVYKDQAVQAALQHFFAPGILYNSIKAGVACDWASYTNESGLEPSYFGDSVKYYETLDGTSVLKYSSRMAPQWYTGGRTGSYDVTELLVTQPTSVDSTTATSEITDFSKSITTNEGAVLNSYTDPNNFNVDYNIKNLIITKAPSKRLPFESILDPYKYLLDGRDGTQVSDSTNHILTHQNQHFLMNPSYYEDPVAYNITAVGGAYTVTEDTANSNYKNYNYPYFEISKGVQSKDNRYELSINNFIAETTKFFIKGESLSSFASAKPQGEGYLMESGSTYYMDVVLDKSSEFLPVNSPGGLGGRYFGPPVRWIDGDGSFDFYGYEKDKISDAAFAPYVPPYFYASTTARVSFSATETKKYSLDEIFKFSEIEEVSPQVDEYFSNQALGRVRKSLVSGSPQSPDDGDYQDSVAFSSRMPLSASIELFGKTSLSRQEFDEEGNPVSISTANNEELDTWVIYSKFECPLFDFSAASNASDEGTLSTLGITTDTAETVSTDNYEYTSSYLDTTNTERFTTDKRTGSGIWAGYGSQVDGKGVTISIRESFPQGVSATTGSLIEVCGFTPETKQIGRVADSKEISEAVLMIPFLDEPLTTEQRLFGGESRQVYATINVDDRNFIKINNLEYRKQKRDFDKNQVIYTTDSGEEIRQTSITNMIEGMRNYNVPPLFDFETYDEAPFAMYFFEFKHTLDREDLSNIWQGLQPKVAKEASLDSVEISHEINSHELFGNLGEIPKGVRWMVFKVKKKAEKSYYNLTEDSRDDSRFKFDFEVGTKEPEYGYNYPYDYFTMLEMIQVEANAEKEIDPVEQYRKRKGESEE